MGLFQAGANHDRARILDAAARARAGKKRERAIALYRFALAAGPQDIDLHVKLAPLLAETGQPFDAWCSFRIVARACLVAGHPDRALAVYSEATLYLPREVEAWQAVARLKLRSGRTREALEALLEGSRNFRSRWLRPQAIFLLRRARELDAWNFEVVLEIARLLASSDQKPEARLLLTGLAQRSSGERLRRVRGAELQVSPGPRSLWHWLRGLLRLAEQDPPAEAPALPEHRPTKARPARHPAVVPIRTARRA